MNRPSLTDPAMEPVWRAVRERLEARGTSARGRVRLPPLTSEARRTLAGLLGRAVSALLDLDALERSLVALDVGPDLPGALSALGFPVTGERAARRAARADRAAARDAARRTVGTWPEDWAGGWVDEVIRAGLLRGLDEAGATALATSVRRVLDDLDPEAASRTESRTDLAARVLGSSHALDSGTALEAAVSRALVHRAGHDLDDDAWQRAGVHRDLVSGAVLTWGLPVRAGCGLAPVVRAANDAGIPIHLTRFALLAHPLDVDAAADVLVAENPRLVEAAAQRRTSSAVVTTNGNPSATVRLLLAQLLAAGVRLRYHGDFDAPGLAMCARMHRFGLHPWRMDAVHYRQAVDQARVAGVELPVEGRRVGPTPWDPPLQHAITDLRRIVHEERLLDDLLA